MINAENDTIHTGCTGSDMYSLDVVSQADISISAA